MRVLLVLTALALAACGGSSDDSKASKAMEDVKEAAGSVAEAVEEVVEDSSESVSDAYKDTMEKAEDVGEVIKDQAEDVEAHEKSPPRLVASRNALWRAVSALPPTLLSTLRPTLLSIMLRSPIFRLPIDRWSSRWESATPLYSTAGV